MGFNLKLLLASTLLCLHLFVNHGFALPFGSVLENESRLVAGFFKGCPCFGPADACFSVNRTDITDNIRCFETLHLCLAGCSLPDQACYNDTTDDEPTTPAKNVSPTEVAGLIEAPLVEKRLTCLGGCYSTWNVCQGWAVFFFSTYDAHIATCDYFFEYCATNNCHLPVQPRPPRVAFKPVPAGTPKAKRGDEILDVPLEERDPTPAVEPTGTACTTFCHQGWRICVALVDGSKGMFAPSDCDKYEEGCINNCYTPVYPKSPPPKRDLAPRAAATPVNAWAEICNINCNDGWQICVALVDGSKGEFSLEGCDTYMQSCQAACWNGKRDAPITLARDGTVSSASLSKRDPANPNTKGKKECQTLCNDRFIICMALVNGSRGMFSDRGCYEDIDNCENNCKAPPTDIEPPKRRDSSHVRCFT